MAAERRPRRSKQQSLPIIHFYEQFVKSNSTRNAKTNRSVDTTAPTVQLSMDSRRRRPRSTISSDSHTETEIQTRKASSPVSPLTPASPSSTVQRGRRRTTSSRLATNHPGHNDSKNATRKPRKEQTKRNSATRKLTMYERSQIHLKEREKKLQTVRDEMMKECTFRPNSSLQAAAKKKWRGPRRLSSSSTTKISGGSGGRGGKTATRKSPTDKSSSIRTPGGSTAATTPTTASTTRQYWQDLQRRQQQQRYAASATMSKDGSLPSKMSSTAKSMRFEELYQDGLRKAQLRPATEKEEQEQRTRRLEDEQLRECTFKPKLYWGNKVTTHRRKPLTVSSVVSSRTYSSRRGHHSLSPHRRQPASKQRYTQTYQQKQDPIPNINLSPIQTDNHHQNGSCGRPGLLRQDVIPPLPLEITTTGIAPISPVRKSWITRYLPRDEAVSPLRGPTLGIEIDREQEHSPIAPRVIFCGTTVGGESEAAESLRTEYGSI